MSDEKKKREQGKRTLRRDAERFRQLKNRVLVNELRRLLPPQTGRAHPPRQLMAIADVVRNAARYIQILGEALKQNDRNRETVLAFASMIQTSPEQMQAMQQAMEEQEQKLLDEKIDKLVMNYGNRLVRDTHCDSKNEQELRGIIDSMKANHRYLGNAIRRDSLGIVTHPLMLTELRNRQGNVEKHLSVNSETIDQNSTKR